MPVVLAHLVTTGLGPLYDGVSHVLVSPDDLLPLIALGLLGGLNGPAAGRRALLVAPLAWGLGGGAGFALGGPLVPEGFAALSSLGLGVLVASGLRVTPRGAAVVAGLVGGLHGWLNGTTLAQAQRESLGLVGIVCTAFVLVALTAGLAVSLRSSTARIAARVAGSWVAAIGLLMAGWSLRGR